MVSNRLPVAYIEDSSGEKIPVLSPGGLVAALAPALAGTGAAWVGWDGTENGSEVAFALNGFVLQPVALTGEQISGHYEGFSNSTLWPLCHDVGVPAEFSPHWWDAYVEVNQLFAQRVVDTTAPHGTVFVQDYHLMLVPALVRKARKDISIGYFHHIPFPSPETLQTLANAKDLIEGLCGSDLVGFQRHRDVQSFERAVAGTDIPHTDRQMPRSGAYPISIDTQSVSDSAATHEVRQKALALRSSWGNPDVVFLGVDRLDYTKGIPQRLLAFEELLATGVASAENVVFVQAGSPSRENVARYQALSAEIDAIIHRVNSTQLSSTGRKPIVYLRENLPREDMLALFVAADVMVVTSLADGMNLVAKEFVACRGDDSGVLILSTQAGAAEQMTKALLVDATDISDITRAMGHAMEMDDLEIARRMAVLREDLAVNDVALWTRNILGDLRDTRSK